MFRFLLTASLLLASTGVQVASQTIPEIPSSSTGPDMSSTGGADPIDPSTGSSSTTTSAGTGPTFPNDPNNNGVGLCPPSLLTTSSGTFQVTGLNYVNNQRCEIIIRPDSIIDNGNETTPTPQPTADANLVWFLIDIPFFDSELSFDFLRFFATATTSSQQFVVWTQHGTFPTTTRLAIQAQALRVLWSSDVSITQQGWIVEYQVMQRLPSSTTGVTIFPFGQGEAQPTPTLPPTLPPTRPPTVPPTCPPAALTTPAGTFQVTGTNYENSQLCIITVAPDQIPDNSNTTQAPPTLTSNNSTDVNGSTPSLPWFLLTIPLFDTEQGFDFVSITAISSSSSGQQVEVLSTSGNRQIIPLAIQAQTLRFRWTTDSSVTRQGWIVNYQVMAVLPPTTGVAVVPFGQTLPDTPTLPPTLPPTTLSPTLPPTQPPTVPPTGLCPPSEFTTPVGTFEVTGTNYVNNQLCIITVAPDQIPDNSNATDVNVTTPTSDATVSLPWFLVTIPLFETEQNFDFLEITAISSSSSGDQQQQFQVFRESGVLRLSPLAIQAQFLRFDWTTDGSVTGPGWIVNYQVMAVLPLVTGVTVIPFGQGQVPPTSPPTLPPPGPNDPTGAPSGNATSNGGLSYIPTMSLEDWASLAQIIGGIINTGHGPVLVRNSFHDAGTFDQSNPLVGGPHASMRFTRVANFRENRGLELARSLLNPIKAQFGDKISHADLWHFAAAVVVSNSGGPVIPFRAGRADATFSMLPADGLLPDGEPELAQPLRQKFNRMGFPDRAIVTLSGAHVLGACHLQNSGYSGQWTRDNKRFSNQYFKNMVQLDYGAFPLSMPPFNDPISMQPGETVFRSQWNATSRTDPQTSTGNIMILNTDFVLRSIDSEFMSIVREYASNQTLFYQDFTRFFTQLQELGMNGALQPDIIPVIIPGFVQSTAQVMNHEPVVEKSAPLATSTITPTTTIMIVGVVLGVLMLASAAILVVRAHRRSVTPCAPNMDMTV